MLLRAFTVGGWSLHLLRAPANCRNRIKLIARKLAFRCPSRGGLWRSCQGLRRRGTWAYWCRLGFRFPHPQNEQNKDEQSKDPGAGASLTSSLGGPTVVLVAAEGGVSLGAGCDGA